VSGSASPQRARGHSDGEGIGGLAIGAVAVPPPFADALAVAGTVRSGWRRWGRPRLLPHSPTATAGPWLAIRHGPRRG